MPDSAIPATYGDPQPGVYLSRAAALFALTALGPVSASAPVAPPTFPLLTRLERATFRGSWRGSQRGGH